MDGEWGETNVVDVVEDKELWTQPTLATMTTSSRSFKD